MSNAVAKATVKLCLIGTARSGEAFALRDFLQRSVVEFDWIEFGADDQADRELRLDDAEIQRLPIVQLPDESDSMRLRSASLPSIWDGLRSPVAANTTSRSTAQALRVFLPRFMRLQRACMPW